MALRDLPLPDLLDLAQSGVDRMRSGDNLEQLMGLSFLRQVTQVIQARVLDGPQYTTSGGNCSEFPTSSNVSEIPTGSPPQYTPEEAKQ